MSNTEVHCRTIQLTHGYYSGIAYAIEFKDKLNAAGHINLLGSYKAEYSVSEGLVNVSTNSGYTFTFMSDEHIANHDGTSGLTIDKTNPRSGNRVIRNTVNGNTSSSPLNYIYNIYSASFKSGFLALLGVKHLFGAQQP